MKEKNKITFGIPGGTAEIEQEYNFETGEITFSGKVKIDRNKKDGKRIFYYSLIDEVPITSYSKNRPSYRKVGGEKDEADELVKLRYGIDMDD